MVSKVVYRGANLEKKRHVNVTKKADLICNSKSTESYSREGKRLWSCYFTPVIRNHKKVDHIVTIRNKLSL